MKPFYRQDPVPVNSVVLCRSREEALAFPVHRIDLHLCLGCGFIFNAAFEPERVHYGEGYEETQACSATFREFHETLARELVERHGLRGKDLVEIGCGKGEFISRLCEIGGNRGVAFDPSYVPERNRSPARDQIRFEQCFFGPETKPFEADFVCCKMTLEHVPEPLRLVSAMRDGIRAREGQTVFVQVPDARRVLADTAFWDIYYEHCSYFSAGSLARLFRRAGFRVERTSSEYGGQYLMIEASRREDESGVDYSGGEAVAELAAEVDRFEARIAAFVRSWRDAFDRLDSAGKPVVLWGGGSKAVAFLSSVGDGRRVAAAVDINPVKQGNYLPHHGHPVIAPAELRALDPGLVVMMNPVYRDEIAAELATVGLSVPLVGVDEPEEAGR